jgi:hypothetical protein
MWLTNIKKHIMSQFTSTDRWKSWTLPSQVGPNHALSYGQISCVFGRSFNTTEYSSSRKKKNITKRWNRSDHIAIVSYCRTQPVACVRFMAVMPRKQVRISDYLRADILSAQTYSAARNTNNQFILQSIGLFIRYSVHICF